MPTWFVVTFVDSAISSNFSHATGASPFLTFSDLKSVSITGFHLFDGYGRSYPSAFETFAIQQKSPEERPYPHCSIHGATTKTRPYEDIEKAIEIFACAPFIIDAASYCDELTGEAR
jgi:hypothetical protein